MSVRVRFAPSPTGFLHVGNARTVLYNWIFARQRKGAFILRVEDTDMQRSERRYEEQLIHDLKWLGLLWDEGLGVGGRYGPYRQSDRLEVYQGYAQRLLSEEKAYYCFCSSQELERERKVQMAAVKQPQYSGECRKIPFRVAQDRLAEGQRAALRLKVRKGQVGFEDIVFGPIQIDCSVLGDFVVLRSERSATYNFAAVVDDVLMKVTHVIRGEGHISNTSRQLLIYEALGFQPPRFAHLSTILGKDGDKLSKRHGAASVSDFRGQGYLPEALLNYLALLGWAPQEEGREILATEQLLTDFELPRVHRSPAIFDLEKLNWVNRAHLKSTEPARLIELATPYLQKAGLIPDEPSSDVREWMEDVLKTFLDYLDKLADLERETRLIVRFNPDKDLSDPHVGKILAHPGAREVIRTFSACIGKCDSLDADAYRRAVSEVREVTEQKGKNLFHPIRVAVTARASGPELEKLVPLLERGKRLRLPLRILGVAERVRAVVHWLDRH